MLHEQPGDIQAARYQTMQPSDIRHGAPMNREIFETFLPLDDASRKVGIPMIDLGGGYGGTAWDLDQRGYGVTVVDINRAQIAVAKSVGLAAHEGDVRTFGDKEVWLPLVCLEHYEAVIMEALLCNMIGSDTQRVMSVADMYLRPGGYVFITEMLRNDQEAQSVLEKLLNAEHAGSIVQRWTRRYKNNFDAGLADGTFVVMPDGETKIHEWESADYLRDVISTGSYLRFARHFGESELRQLIVHNGFDIRHMSHVVWNSAAGPILGCQIVAQKGAVYKYQPWYKGLTPLERGNERLQHWRKTMQHRYPRGYDIEFWKRLQNNIPPEQKIAFEALAQIAQS